MRASIRIAVGAMMLVTAACGRLNDAGGGSSGSEAIPHPTGPDELVLRVEYQGGFVAYEYTLRRVPTWSLMGDGTVILEGPQIEIYPQPALPPLVATPISEGGVQAILGAAREAGLLNGNATYGFPCIADAADTVFTVNADGTISAVSAYALDLTSPPAESTDCPGVDTEARAKLSRFLAKLGDLRGWLPEGSIGPERAYEPTAMRVYVMPYQGQPDLPQADIEWPLAQPLDAFGRPVSDDPSGSELRCGVVSGEELTTLLPAAGRSNELTPWSSGGPEYRLIFRPLLPDEHTC